jgi:hypothetical protein
MKSTSKCWPVAMLGLLIGLVVGTQAADSGAKADLVGTIRDVGEQPIANARVSIFRSFAPFPRSHIVNASSPDESKTARTDSAGRFRIEELDTNAMFQVLFEADGFRPMFYYRLRPSEPVPEVTLKRVPRGAAPNAQVRGRVTNEEGKPIEGALIQVQGTSRGGESRSGSWEDIEWIAFSDESGAFILRGEEAFDSVDLAVEARGFAPSERQDDVRTGAAIHEVRLKRGGSIKGRLLKDGQPAANAGVGLTATQGSADRYFAITTDAEGRFHFRNVPTGRTYFLFSIMESLSERGGSDVERVVLNEGVSDKDVGDLQLQPGFELSGVLRFDDGTPPQPNFTLSLYRTVLNGDVELNLDPWVTFPSKDNSKRFQFKGVPAGPVSLYIKGPPFYRLSPRNVSGDPAAYRLAGRVTGNKTNLVFEIVRGEQPKDVLRKNLRDLLEQPIRGAE